MPTMFQRSCSPFTAALQRAAGGPRRPSLRRARGFTLIEIMVVVIIAKAKQDIQAMETALTMFKLDNFVYPSNEMGLKALVQKPDDPSIRNWRAGGYLQHLNKDPWGNDYQYQVPGTHGTDYDLYSLGADGQPGGEGENADIGNWNLQ